MTEAPEHVSDQLAVRAALERAAWDSVVFADAPSRFDLLRLPTPSWPLRPVRVLVHRNQPFETLLAPLARFLEYAGYSLDLHVGPYDDSLQFASDGREAEVEIVWLDLARYRDRLDDAALAAWLEDRLQARRAVTDAPLLVADASANSRATDDRPVVRRAVEAVPGTRALGVSSVLERLGHDGLDARATALTASALSDRAVIGIAREVAFGTIVPVLEPRIKAVAVDLDGTLYDGVLGEDGPDGIALTETHRELQRRLVALREEGVFLALVTRNEPMDVTALFERRTDMLLRPEHVSSIQIGWGPKSTALESAADELRIATNSVLFLDDNAGEIAAAAAAVAGLRTFHARDPDLTARALAAYPGLAGYDRDETDRLRIDDLAAHAARSGLRAAAPDPAAYLRDLGVTLRYHLRPKRELERIAALSGKANQFNTALRRFGEPEIARRLADPEAAIVAIALEDRLTDAGTIAAVVTRRDGGGLLVEEIAVSCRALGRGVEDAMLCAAVVRAMDALGVDAARFAFVDGPRNGPARSWLAGLTDGRLDGDVDRAALESRMQALDGLVTMTWEQDG